MAAAPSETILVVPRAAFFAGDWPQGFLPAQELPADHSVRALEAAGLWVARDAAEQDESLKQLIPYCVVVRAGSVFCVERLPRGGEARLHGLLSIGIGGHVSVPPGSSPALESAPGAVERGLARELAEELVLPPGPPPSPTFLGLLNDDATPVGRVHVGLVYRWEPAVPAAGGSVQVRVREISKLRGSFESLAAQNPVWQDRTRFESWSWILLQAARNGLVTG
ncbi:MAG: hypothetical protein IT458_03485 [Planctomycetes bacterium]|nr:hypothetical protein [Planctomycetota bacterium]